MLQLQDQIIKCVTQNRHPLQTSDLFHVLNLNRASTIFNLSKEKELKCFQMNVQVFRCKQTWSSPAVRYPRSHPEIGSDKNTRMNLRTWSWTAASPLWEELKEAVHGSSQPFPESVRALRTVMMMKLRVLRVQTSQHVYSPTQTLDSVVHSIRADSSFSYILKQLLILDKVLKWWVHGLREKRSSNLPVLR